MLSTPLQKSKPNAEIVHFDLSESRFESRVTTHDTTALKNILKYYFKYSHGKFRYNSPYLNVGVQLQLLSS